MVSPPGARGSPSSWLLLLYPKEHNGVSPGLQVLRFESAGCLSVPWCPPFLPSSPPNSCWSRHLFRREDRGWSRSHPVPAPSTGPGPEKIPDN